MTAPAAAADGLLTTGEFFAGVREGRLVVQRCGQCGALAVPPKAICPGCEGTRWGRVTLGGDGEVASYTVIHVAPAPLAAEAPYAIAVVRMAEGVSLLGRLLGVPHDQLAVGLPVRAVPPAADVDPPVIAFRRR